MGGGHAIIFEFVHYHLRLRLKCIQKKVELNYDDSLHNDFVQGEEDLIIGWLEV